MVFFHPSIEVSVSLLLTLGFKDVGQFGCVDSLLLYFHKTVYIFLNLTCDVFDFR